MKAETQASGRFGSVRGDSADRWWRRVGLGLAFTLLLAALTGGIQAATGQAQGGQPQAAAAAVSCAKAKANEKKAKKRLKTANTKLNKAKKRLALAKPKAKAKAKKAVKKAKKAWNKAKKASTRATAVRKKACAASTKPLLAKQISAGSTGPCAILLSNQVVCWGVNRNGELGNGTVGGEATKPVAVKNLGDAVAVSRGNEHTCAIRQSRQAVCWGSARFGRLGNGQTGNDKRSTEPVNVQGLDDAIAIDAGYYTTCAIRASGQVVCWGHGEKGTLGNGTSGEDNDSAVPVNVSGLTDAVEISVGWMTACARRQSGQVVCWGEGKGGELGNNVEADSSVPVDVQGMTDAKALNIDSSTGCAVRTSGQAFCWGSNGLGQFGSSTYAADELSLVPVPVPGFSDVTMIVSDSNGCFLRQSGQVMCWGPLGSGAVGNGAPMSHGYALDPQNVVGLNDAIQITTAEGLACALRVSKQAVCWGIGGELGDGTDESSSVPVDVIG